MTNNYVPRFKMATLFLDDAYDDITLLVHKQK
jgi:hypothetical protein